MRYTCYVSLEKVVKRWDTLLDYPLCFSEKSLHLQSKCKGLRPKMQGVFGKRGGIFLGRERLRCGRDTLLVVFPNLESFGPQGSAPNGEVTNSFRKTCGNARTREGVSSVTSQYCIEKLMPRRIMSFNTGESLFKKPSHERTLTGLHPTSLNAKARG